MKTSNTTLTVFLAVILDRGYKVSGNAGGDTVFDGKVCDLEAPFTIKTNNPFVPSFKFTPSTNLPTVGTWKLATADGLVGSGGGEYTLEGSDTEKTGIYMFGNSHGHMLSSGERFGGGDSHLTLTPLTAADGECSQ